MSDGAVTRVGLVNNAADPGFLGPLEGVDPARMLRVHAVNVVAPVSLAGWVLRRADPELPVRIANVSSRAAVQPFPGLGVYGATKAALEHSGRALAAELALAGRDGGPRPDATVLSYNPGPVDTPMQESARASPVGVLPTVAVFARFHAEGALASPAGPAGDLADYLDGDGHPGYSELRHRG